MDIRIRKYNSSDAAAIDEIYDRCHYGTFNRPNLNRVISSAVIEINGKLVAYGALELIAEAVLILDTDSSKRHGVIALQELIQTAMFMTKHMEFDRFYLFPSSDPYMELLKKHFNFKNCSPILVCNLSE